MRASVRSCIPAFLHSCIFFLVFVGAVQAVTAQSPTAAGPVVVVETTRGTFAFETYPRDAPLTVAHIVELVRRGF